MSATENARNLANVLKFNDDLTLLSLTGMSDESARRRLRDGGPSVAWNIGHMLYHRNQIAAAIGCRAPVVDVALFAGARPTAAAIRRCLNSGRRGRSFPRGCSQRSTGCPPRNWRHPHRCSFRTANRHSSTRCASSSGTRGGISDRSRCCARITA